MPLEPFSVTFLNGDTAQARLLHISETRIRSFDVEEWQHRVWFEVEGPDGGKKPVQLVISDRLLSQLNERTGITLTDDERLLRRLFHHRCSGTVFGPSELSIGPKDIEAVLDPVR